MCILVWGLMKKNVVDGNLVICMSIKDIGGNFEYKIVWWKVDFG